MKVGRSFRAVVALSLLGSVGLALSPRGASGWQAAISIGAFPPHFTNTEGLGVAATADGDVVVVGWYEFAVIKLAGKTGQEIWRYSLGPGYTAAVAVDAAGDVLAAGSTTLPVFRQFTVVKLSGETGAEVWRRDISGTDPVFSDGFGAGIASDAAGDVLASGYVNGDAIVVKLSGDAGTELWRYAGGGGTGLVYSTVKVDPHGDAIAAGAFGPAWTVVKLAGVSGAQVWRDDIPDLEYVAISLSGSGDVAAEGWTGSVFFLSGTDGSELWRRVGNDGTNCCANPRMPRLAILPSGDVVTSHQQFAVATLAAADGHELWRQTLGCAPGDVVEELGVDAAGDVVAAGSRFGCAMKDDFTIAKLSGTTGTERWRRSYDARQPGDFYANAMATLPSADIVAVGETFGPADLIPPGLPAATTRFTVLEFSGADGTLMVCGDGYVDAGEECDFGNMINLDCCSGTCRSAADGTSCSDDNLCTRGDAGTPTFASIECRVAALVARVGAASELAAVRTRLLARLQQTTARKQHAESLCAQGKRRPTRKAFRPALAALARFVKVVRSQRARAASSSLAHELRTAADSIRRDMRTLQRHVVCPAH